MSHDPVRPGLVQGRFLPAAEVEIGEDLLDAETGAAHEHIEPMLGAVARCGRRCGVIRAISSVTRLDILARCSAG